MISLVIAALLQAAPTTAGQGDGLPKDDYERVAWCHGALAAQLELDPIVKLDMEKIEGKAKVAARAKDDAELARERREYMKEYERALSAAEKASPTMIHPKGVAAEQQGYRFWAPTRNKEPIWRMLDWGMWDPNDVGCSDSAKRLLNKSQLFGAALRGDDKADVAEAPATEVPKASEALAEAASAPAPTAEAVTKPAHEATTDAGPGTASPPRPVPPKKAKVPAKVAKAAAKPKPKPGTTSAEAIRDAIANGKAELEKPADTAPAPSAEPPPLRGPQQP